MSDKIKGYEIVEELNKGAFCDSYKVRKGGKDYFMKEYKDPTMMSADYSEFLENQRIMIPILKKLGDQTETIVEDFEDESIGRYYQVKVLINSSVNLRDWMCEVFDYDKRLDVAIQFATILKNVHGEGIIHQDLKPEQVMTVKDPTKKAGIRLVLTDFDWSVPNGRIVRLVGTPGYCNIDCDDLSYKSDIFTFGIILTELLAGTNPFILTEDGEERIYEQSKWYRWVKNREFVSPKVMNPDLPDAINSVIVRSLDPDQRKRPSLDEILDALKGKRKKVTISAPSGDKMILVPGTTYGRTHFKELFKRTVDDAGNPVYKYLDQVYGIVSITQDADRLLVSYPAYGKAKNQLRLNGKELTDVPTPIQDGDRLSIYSTARFIDVVSFTVAVS